MGHFCRWSTWVTDVILARNDRAVDKASRDMMSKVGV